MDSVFPRSLLWTAALGLSLACSAWAGNWPQWRGPAGNSVSDETHLPTTWSEQSNVLWKCALPGSGASTPAIWGDAIFVTCQDQDKLLLVKIDKPRGTIAWTRQVGTGSPARREMGANPRQFRKQQRFHKLHNMASPSPVTDGELVVIHFGNGDLAAYDFADTQLWHRNLQKDYGPYTIWWGHANSPVLYKDLVISVCMQDSLLDLREQPAASYVVAHNKRTGKEVWKTMRMTPARAEQCDSYTTPVFYRAADHVEIIVMGADQIDAYDPATGKQLWYLPGLARGRVITGPTVANGMVYATEGFRGPLHAIRLGGHGKLSADAIAWKQTSSTPDSSSPVVWRDLIFWITDNGIAHCHDARTGASKWEMRLPGDYKASPLAADGKIYFLNLAGPCTVVAAEPAFRKLADNTIGDETIASPAVSDGKIYLRGKKALYCIGSK
jgi:outer membrane protein assembly factor BamB